jgi:hypothetical protein
VARDDEQISIEEVGIMPAYRQEGYWLVPDTQAAQLNLLRYEVSLFPLLPNATAR